ncbi:MAG TPA: lipopolysaccharide heptosyltransferase II [Planctomycetaceae bacterium]|nr:lipopolysaccharide heptosyltransferase II [Planctomycetaceae bacterium]
MPFRIPCTRLLEIDARRICLIKPSALGDVVQMLPLLGMLRQRFPTATVSWVIRRDFAELVTGHPDLTEIIPFHRKGSWNEFVNLLATLRRRRFDLVCDLQGLFRTAVMTVATGANTRIGLESSREGASLAYNCVVSDSSHSVPAHIRYWRLAEALGMADHPRLAVVPTTLAERLWLVERLSSLARPILAIHHSAGWETKRWPVDKFAEIARRFEGSVIIVGSAADRALADRLIDAMQTRTQPAINLAGQTTLKQLAALLGAVDLVVSNDSGPMHLAAALGTPVVGIFTCTSPNLSGPEGTKHELISTGVPCAASYYKRCPHRGPAHLACLAELPVERVWNAVMRILARRPAAKSA